MNIFLTFLSVLILTTFINLKQDKRTSALKDVTGLSTTPADIIAENKDSVIMALIRHMKEYHPEALMEDMSDSIDYSTFSYLGVIINDDSVVTNRIMTVQIFMKNAKVERRILVFTPKDLMGYYASDHETPSLPRKIINYRFLSFDKTTVDFNGRTVPVKINISRGIPESFTVQDEVFFLKNS